ncbi:hypothetical protein ACSFA2_04005 [Variovorax sp. LT2P21]|uniref:hypothetical protein n=1 Tax=Variovorax sp. LT2P21 TaxID=3443731 RepID=UPI003F48A05B
MHFVRPAVYRTPLLIALAVALWLASTLGLMHRVVHLPATPAAAYQHTAPVVSAASSHGHDHRGLLALFGVHADADCRLYDQLAGGAAALSVPLVVLPIALPMARFHYFLGEALARWVSLFDARGPPLTR